MLTLSCISAEATDVSGTITANTTWNLVGSPYIVIGNVSTMSGATLTINPGVTVKFDGYYAISGNINAQGTTSQMITFTSNKPTPAKNDWYCLSLTSSSIIKYAVIEYANYGVYGNYVSPAVQNNIIRNNTAGVYFRGNSLPVVTYNTIIDNDDGIYLDGYYIASFPRGSYNYNSIYNNINYNLRFTLTNESSWYIINATNNWWGTTDPYAIMAKIRDGLDQSPSASADFAPFLDGPGGNSIGGSYVFGGVKGNTTWTKDKSPYIVITNASVGNLIIQPGVEVRFDGNYSMSGTLNAQGTAAEMIKFTSNKPSPAKGDWWGISITSSTIIRYTTIEYSANGLYCNGISPTIEYSAIQNNTQGIYVIYNSYPTVRYNTIKDNDIGIRLLGNLSYYPGGVYNYNSIYNNSQWNIYAWTGRYTYTIDMKYNWWGTTDPYQIMARIDDRRTHGKDYATIDFIPFLDSAGGNPLPSYLAGMLNTNRTLAKDNSPYVVVTSIASDTGATLTVEPGVALRFDGNYSISMNLNAQGTAAEMITFTSNKMTPARGDWWGLAMTGSSAIKYAVIEYAAYGLYGNYISPSIFNNIIRYNTHGIYMRGDSLPTVTYNTIYNNYNGISLDGYYIASFPRGSYNYNSIYDNSNYNLYFTLNNESRWYVINAENNWWGTTSEAAISASIRDGYDQSPSPTADFMPFLSGPVKAWLNPSADRMQDGVDLVSDNGIIYLSSGTYDESEEIITINGKNIFIVSSGIDAPVIKGNIAVANGSLYIRGIDMLYQKSTYMSNAVLCDAGITAINSGLTTENCTIMPDPDITGGVRYGKGIQIWSLYNNQPVTPAITGCRIRNTDSGIYLFSQSFGGEILGTIENNILENNNYGILERMHKENPLIQNNTVSNSIYGIHITYQDGSMLNTRLSNILNNLYSGNAHNVWCDEIEAEVTP